MMKKRVSLGLGNGEFVTGYRLSHKELIELNLPMDTCVIGGCDKTKQRCIYIGPVFTDTKMEVFTRSTLLEIEYALLLGAKTEVEADKIAINKKGVTKFRKALTNMYEVRNKYTVDILSSKDINQLVQNRIHLALGMN